MPKPKFVWDEDDFIVTKNPPGGDTQEDALDEIQEVEEEEETR